MDGRTPHGLVYLGPRNCAAVVYIRVMQLSMIFSINRTLGDQMSMGQSTCRLFD